MRRSTIIIGAVVGWITFGFPHLGRAEDKIEIVGKYQCKGNDLDGMEYTGKVEIKKRGDTYALKWSIDGFGDFEGLGLRTDNVLSVSWLSGVNAGVMVYQIEKGPKLMGRWAQFRAKPTVQKEVLTVEK